MIKKLISGLRWFNVALRHPGVTTSNLLTLPFLTQGRQFGRQAKFWPDSRANVDQINQPNELASYFLSHDVGPGIWKWMHYFDIYERHLSKFAGREVNIVEIGIYSGGSLGMWKHYFGDGCHVWGVDIEEACRAYETERVSIVIGDQADRSFWKKFKRDVPIVDIVIDDGGHLAEQQLVTFEELMPHIRPGGVYLCEDITTTHNRFAAYIHGLSNNLNAASWQAIENGVAGIASSNSELQSAINSIHLYPFVAVVEKNEHPLQKLVSPKKGTQWQPFL
jgi:hypothetical protein